MGSNHFLQTIFEATGPIAKHLKDYELRPQQIRMALTIREAIASGRHLLVEAGTGVGKSLAYLIPFIEWTERNDKKVIISTYTKMLQEQLIKKDLPFLKKALSFEIRFALCLGGQNYLCLRRLKKGYHYNLFESERETREINKISEWLERTDTGLRSDLDFEPNESTWSKVCRETDLCLGKKCPHRMDCFYNKARRKEYKAQILVTNHHLYFANLISGGKVLPKFDAVVFDEAHTLEDVATDYLGIEVSNFQLKYFLDSIFNPETGKGLLNWIPKLSRKERESLEKILNEVRSASQLFFLDLVSQFGEDSKILRMRKRNFIFNHLKEPLFGLLSELVKLEEKVEGEEEEIEIKSFISRGQGINSGLEAIISQSLDGYVYWIEILNRPKRSLKLILRAAPIDISREFRKNVLNKVNPIVFTSATLSTNKSFEFIKTRLGLGDADELLLDSPFNYRENVLTYLCEDLPDPSIDIDLFREEAIAKIKKILSITNGRAFVLFTSFKMMDAAYDRLKEELEDLYIFRQGDEPRYKLLERFKRQDKSVLLGTNSFWQGVDVPGKALECVIIAKLPFAVPDDPVIEARMESLQAQNKNPFIHYQIPQAIIMLRQGFGRLIRTKNDRGMVALLDPRIKIRFYGKRFLEALPECRQTSDLEEVKRFFAR